MTNRSKTTGEHLTKEYRNIGIDAVAAAVKSNRFEDRSDKAQTDQGHTKQEEASMNEQSRQFAEKSTNVVRENFERGVSAFGGMRELNLKLIEMTHDNTEAAFELAHEIASAKAPSELAEIWAKHARRQFELMTRQSKEIADLGQKLAGRTTEPFARSFNEA
jgi:hypothetical protein